MPESPAAPPEIDVCPVHEAHGSGPWEVAFDITNAGSSDVRLLEAWLPHTILHADAIDLSTSAPLGPTANVKLRFTVTFEPRKSGEPSNPFLIVRALQNNLEWRILARLTVESGAYQEPVISLAAITLHQVGFSQADG